MSQPYQLKDGQKYLITARNIGAITADQSANVTLQRDPSRSSIWIAIQNSQNNIFSLLN